jgi:hypothetical protein
MNILLISEEYIKSNTNISDNLDGNYLLPTIKLAQSIDLEEVIGTQFLIKLQNLVEDNSIKDIKNSHYKLFLDNFVQPFLCYATITKILPTVAYKIANAGVLRTEDEKMTNISSVEVDKIILYYKNIADTFKYRMQRYLLANYNKFPELMTYKSIADLRVNLYSSASCPLWLGGNRGKLSPYNSYGIDFGYNFPNADIDLK